MSANEQTALARLYARRIATGDTPELIFWLGGPLAERRTWHTTLRDLRDLPEAGSRRRPR